MLVNPSDVRTIEKQTVELLQSPLRDQTQMFKIFVGERQFATQYFPVEQEAQTTAIADHKELIVTKAACSADAVTIIPVEKQEVITMLIRYVANITNGKFFDYSP